MELILIPLSPSLSQSSQQGWTKAWPQVPLAPQQAAHLCQSRPQQPREDGAVQERHRPGPGADFATRSQDIGDSHHQVGHQAPVVPGLLMISSLQEQRRAPEETETTQTEDSVGGGTLSERESKDRAGEGVQETVECQEEERK